MLIVETTTGRQAFAFTDAELAGFVKAARVELSGLTIAQPNGVL